MDENDYYTIKNLDFEDDYSVMDAITRCNSGLIDGTNNDDEMIIISIEQGSGIRVTTFQHNGWIRINDYDLANDEYGNLELIRSESYEK